MSLLGKLTLDAIPFHEPIIMVTMTVVAVLGLLVAGLVTKYKKWVKIPLPVLECNQKLLVIRVKVAI